MAVMLSQNPMTQSLLNLKGIVKTTDKLREQKAAEASTAQALSNIAAAGPLNSAPSGQQMATAGQAGTQTTASQQSSTPPGVAPEKWAQIKQLVHDGRIGQIPPELLSKLIASGALKATLGHLPNLPGMDPATVMRLREKLARGDFSSIPIETLNRIINGGYLTVSLPSQESPTPTPQSGPTQPPDSGMDPNPESTPDPPPVTDDPARDTPFQARVREFARFRSLGQPVVPAPVEPRDTTPIPSNPTQPPKGDTLPVEPPSTNLASQPGQTSGIKSQKLAQEELEKDTFGKVVRGY